MMSVNISDIQEMGVRDSKEQMILVVVYMQVRQVTLPCNLIVFSID